MKQNMLTQNLIRGRHLFVIAAVLGGLALLAITLLWLSWQAAPVHADPGTLYVAPGANCGGKSPCYSSVQAAVDAAAPGGEILVASGVYSDIHQRQGITQVVYISMTVTIRGGYTTTNWTTPYPLSQPTTLDAQGQGRVLYITGNISPTIEGLRITGGNATGLGPLGLYAGGGICNWQSDPTLTNCTVISNTAHLGGGIYNHGGTVNVGNRTISDNSAIYGGVGIDNYGGTANVSNSTISDNSAIYGGGGILNYAGTVNVSSSTISDNSAIYEGGDILNYEGTVNVSNRTISGGGGILNYAGTVNVSNSTISNNSAYLGGGISNWGALTVTNSTISGNWANVHGGGIYEWVLDGVTADTQVLMADGSYKRIGDIQVGDAVVGHDFATNKRVTNFVQQTFELKADSYLQINGLEVTDSHPFAVGADQWVNAGQLEVGDQVVGDDLTEITHVARMYEPVSVYNVTVAGTHNFYVSDGKDLFLVHNNMVGDGQITHLNNTTITGNTADYDENDHGDGGGVYAGFADFNPFAPVNFKNTIIAGNTDNSNTTQHPDCSGWLTSHGYNLVGKDNGCTFTSKTGDQRGSVASPLAPLLAGLAHNGGPTETHALQSGSPAIDAGSCTDIAGDPVTTDQRGEPRPMDGDGDGTAICDIGAYEYEAPLPPKPVGGVIVPVSKVELLAPWVGMVAIALLAALGVGLVRTRKA